MNTHNTKEVERIVTPVELHMHGSLSQAIKEIYGDIGGYRARKEHHTGNWYFIPAPEIQQLLSMPKILEVIKNQRT